MIGMQSETAVVLLKTPQTKYSVNALTAILDTRLNTPVYIIEDKDKLPIIARQLSVRYKKIIVGLSLLTYMLADDEFLNYIVWLNGVLRSTGAVSIAGGPHASGDPIGTVYSLGFKYAIVGEAEETLTELVEAIAEGGDPLSVKGVFTTTDGGPVFTGRGRTVNLDDYPPYPYWRYMYNPIEITRGCPYGCKYCQVSYMHGFTLRHRSIDNIINYAGFMARAGLRDLRFISPDSLAYGLRGGEREPRLDMVEELLSGLYEKYVKEYGMRIFYGTFPSEVRPEHLTREAVRILRRYVANREIILGAQTGSNRLLRLIGRGHSIEDVYTAVENAVTYGFTPDVDYIFGLPGETTEDLEETIRSIEKLVSMGARIHLHVFLPLPGTPYAHAPPGRVPGWVKKRLARIIGGGRAYGQWMHQEKLAARIAVLRERGVIMPRIRLKPPVINTKT